LEFFDDKNVSQPTISPDGRYVAYCSGNEGQSGPSKITLRNLDSLGSPRVVLAADTAYVPRWWVNPATGDTCIVYTNSACDDGSSLWLLTQTFSQKISGGTPVSFPQVLVSNGSYHGGISMDGHYAVTGFTRLLMRNIVAGTGIDTQMFVYPHNGKDGNGSTQVCNVSISPDTGNGIRCLFLDFGYQGKTSTITNCSYGIHEYVFVSTMSDSVVNYLHCPAGEQQWDNPKWSNQPEFAVGCGRNSANKSDAIYAIDLDKKSCKQLVTGTELEQPYLLTGNPVFLGGLDSLGRYNDPPLTLWQAELASKLLLYWRVYDSLEAVAVGSSLILWGIDPSVFTGLKTLNMGALAADLLGQKNIILNYILKHSLKTRVICSSFDIGWLNEPDGNHSWKDGIGQSKGYLYDSSRAFWPYGVSSDFKDIIRNVPVPCPQYVENSGFQPVGMTGWGPDPPPFSGGSTLQWDTTDPNYRQNLSTITMLANTLRSRGIHWIMINFPLCPLYKNTPSYTPEGPSWSTAHEIIQNMQELERSNLFFHFYDVYNFGDNDYIYEDFFGESHLDSLGAEKMSSRVAILIDSILR
jgi:hypothetical protein